MRVITATTETQGSLDSDFSLAIEGELVQVGSTNGFGGLASKKATTTAIVTDLPHMTPKLLREAVADSLPAQGVLFPPEIRATVVEEEAELIEFVASQYPAGTVIVKDHDTVTARRFPDAA